MKTRHVSRRFRRFLKAKEAVSALEYSILVGVVAIAVGAAIATFSDTISTAIGNIGTGVTTTTGGELGTGKVIKAAPGP